MNEENPIESNDYDDMPIEDIKAALAGLQNVLEQNKFELHLIQSNAYDLTDEEQKEKLRLVREEIQNLEAEHIKISEAIEAAAKFNTKSKPSAFDDAIDDLDI